ncbi:MAG: hydrogenase maturation protease [Acidobacteria bacterium]|nr:hydrogenase maturation protease [Acidobacteriota bacterium]
MSAGPSRVLIIGVGNELLGDEGLGVHVARLLLASRGALPAGVEVLEAGTALLDLLAEMSQSARVIFVDAIRMGGKPGTLYRAELGGECEEMSGEALPFSLHQCDLFQALGVARLLGLLPGRVTLLGAEPERIEPGTRLSPTLRQASAQLVSALLAETQGVEIKCA